MASPASSPSSGGALSGWLARWLSGAGDKLPANITVSQTRAVERPVHVNERVEKTFTVFARRETDEFDSLAVVATPRTPTTSAILAAPIAGDPVECSAVVCVPGLTLVRVRPELLGEAGPGVLARVRVSSDAAEHLDRLRVELSDENTLTIDYNAAKRGTTGHLVTEVDVPRESQIQQVIAMGGGDVVVHGGALGSPPASARADPDEGALAADGAPQLTDGTGLVALYGSRLFLSAPQRRLRFDTLALAAFGSSSIHVDAQHLAVRREFAAGVLGTGRVDVRTTHFGAASVMLGVASTGSVHLAATQVFHAGGISAYLKGDGAIRVTAPPDAVTEACLDQDISVGRRGTVDLADVPSIETRITAARLFKGTARVRAPTDNLEIECPGSSAHIQHVGQLPPDVRLPNPSALLTQLSEGELASVRAEWDARENAVAVPTIEAAFETPAALDGPREGCFFPIVAPLARCVLPF